MHHEALTRDRAGNARAGTADAPLRLAQTRRDQPDAARRIADDLGPDPLALVVLLVSPLADFAAVVAEMRTALPDTEIAACTTAGEIGSGGYEEDLIVAVGFPADHFAAQTLWIGGLDRLDPEPLSDRVVQAGVTLRNGSPDFSDSFAMLLVDGLSLKEDELVAAISPALAGYPLFGGSAGDGTDFGATQVALNDRIGTNAAVLTLVRTDCRTEVFSLDHMTPTGDQMVVTEADPGRRIVKEINAEPAAREYARIVGKDPEQLDQFTFAAHPVVVRIGDTHHVRAIQQVNPEGELIFFSAIDEGMVLTVATPEDLAPHLATQLERLLPPEQPGVILGFDCVLRRIEAEQRQHLRDVSDVLCRQRVVGFSTYGEQIGPLHVNHTMSGVAIRPARNQK